MCSYIPKFEITVKNFMIFTTAHAAIKNCDIKFT